MTPVHSRRLKLLLFRVVAISLGFLLTIAVDRGIGFIAPAGGAQTGLVYGPHQQMRLDSFEFDVAVTANNLGIRDRDLGPKAPGAFRVVVLGDSFTFGWGVELQQAWVKLLEQQLKDQLGEHVEVINLGKPGGFPRYYAGIFEQAVALFEPDLAVIAVLQGDDLEQHIGRNGRPGGGLLNRCRSVSQVADIATSRLWPNVKMLIARLAPTPAAPVSDQWKGQADWILCQSDDSTIQAFRRLPPTIQEAFLAGKLNPALIDMALRVPQVYTLALDLENDELRRGVEDMAGDLTQIHSVADRHHVAVLAVSVPNPPYASAYSQQAFAELGFMMTPEMLVSQAPDMSIQEAASMAGVPFETVISDFREEAANEPLFYRTDGHFNPAGNRVFARLMLPIFTDAVARTRQTAGSAAPQVQMSDAAQHSP